jgi:predicted anti-sigma-YlaC factor YlaD
MNRFVEDEHRRARDLAATAIDFELEPHEADLLQAHLAGCGACRRWVAGLHADAVDLAELWQRDTLPRMPVAAFDKGDALRPGRSSR